MELPVTNWIKNDPEKHKYFQDGSVFLVALQCGKAPGSHWDFDTILISSDDERLELRYRDGEPYDAWTWEDFEYFILLEGAMPTETIDD